ncbi:MAG: hypothetical protein B7Z08_00850 [Sphingomonadales bacterium 32-68-7]|nr:MAG: hypothetical protein B7Z08_00850 [Sphingomonadales bacterium 32-68-7]
MLTAFASLWLSESGGAVLLIWLPSAVAVVALHTAPVRRWPGMLAGLGAAQVIVVLASGFTLAQAVGLACAFAAEATVCVSLGIWVLGERKRLPRTMRHIAGQFGAAVAGAAASALLAWPWRADVQPEGLAWWFLASVLGILVGTPILLHLRRRFGFDDPPVEPLEAPAAAGLAVTTAALFVLALIVMRIETAPLYWLLVVGIVFAVVRNGQLSAACGVLAYTAAATVQSFGHRSPIVALDVAPFQAGVWLQIMMLAMLATALPIAAILMARTRLEAQLRQQNLELNENLSLLRLAENLAGIGRWQYDMRSGRQIWSEQMLELNGMPRELAPDPGDVRAQLPDGGAILFGRIARERETREPYEIEYPLMLADGSERRLRLVARNQFDPAGNRVGLFAVAMDVTERVQREQALERERERAMQLAIVAQKQALTDQLTGLANRRCTLERLERLVAASRKDGEPLAAVMFDIDHFKLINDSFGHATGDAVLVRVGELARREARGGDLIGRVGGEEFVWLLPGLAPGRVPELAERLRSAIEEGSAAGGLPRVTVSLGHAQFRPGDTGERLLARADAALYEAKEGGRNRVRRAA